MCAYDDPLCIYRPVLSSPAVWHGRTVLPALMLILFSVLQLELTLALCILCEWPPSGQILLHPPFFSLLYTQRSPPPPPLSFVLVFFPLLDLCWLLCNCPRCWNVAGNRALFQFDGWDLWALREGDKRVLFFESSVAKWCALCWSVDTIDKKIVFCWKSFPKKTGIVTAPRPTSFVHWGESLHMACKLVVFAAVCWWQHGLVVLKDYSTLNKQYLNSGSTC